MPSLHRRDSGQSLVEFATVIPVLIVLVTGIVQVGALFFAKHELTQIGRDVGRWAATQQYDPCDGSDAVAAVSAQAHDLADQANLFMYSGSLGVSADWTVEAGSTCPPVTSLDVAWVEVTLSHSVPPIVPGFPTVPLSTSSMFRMEPPPAPEPEVGP